MKQVKQGCEHEKQTDVCVALYVSIHHVPTTVLVCERVTQWRRWAANLDVLEPHNTPVSNYSVRKDLLSYADWKIFYLLH